MPVILSEMHFSERVGRVIQAVRDSHPGLDADGLVEALCTVTGMFLAEWSRVEPAIYKSNRPLSKQAVKDLMAVVSSQDAQLAVKAIIARDSPQQPVIIVAPTQRM